MASRKSPEFPHKAARVCRAICLLAEGYPPEYVAKEVRVRSKTLAAWQRNDDFAALLKCLRNAGHADAVLAQLSRLTPEAVEVMREVMLDGNRAVALSAAKDIFDRIGVVRQRAAPAASSQDSPDDHTIRVEYVNRDGQTVSATPWADRNPAPSGSLQSGGLRSPLREDRDGKDSAD